ncbi:hypothetical protein KI387_023546, partial [Taxus chinensis]
RIEQSQFNSVTNFFWVDFNNEEVGLEADIEEEGIEEGNMVFPWDNPAKPEEGGMIFQEQSIPTSFMAFDSAWCGAIFPELPCSNSDLDNFATIKQCSASDSTNLPPFHECFADPLIANNHCLAFSEKGNQAQHCIACGKTNLYEHHQCDHCQSVKNQGIGSPQEAPLKDVFMSSCKDTNPNPNQDMMHSLDPRFRQQFRQCESLNKQGSSSQVTPLTKVFSYKDTNPNPNLDMTKSVGAQLCEGLRNMPQEAPLKQVLSYKYNNMTLSSSARFRQQFCQCESLNKEGSSSQEAPLRKVSWGSDETLSLVVCRREMDAKFKVFKHNHAGLWEELSRRLRVKHNCDKTPAACLEKWKSILQEHSATKREGEPIQGHLRVVENIVEKDRSVLIKYGTANSRVFIFETATTASIKQAIKWTFGLETPFWLEDKDGIVQPVHHGMPLDKEYSICLARRSWN